MRYTACFEENKASFVSTRVKNREFDFQNLALEQVFKITVYSDVPICDIMNQQQAECSNSVLQAFEADKLNCNCLQRCNETYYSTTYSTALWPSDQYEGYLFSAISGHDTVRSVLSKYEGAEAVEHTLKNVVRLSFVFEELNTQEIMEEPKWAVQDLLAAIGGSMGMYW